MGVSVRAGTLSSWLHLLLLILARSRGRFAPRSWSLDTLNPASRPWHTRGRGDASADDSLRREVGSQSLNTVDEDDADARHLLGPLLDDLGDGGPSTNRRG